MAAADYSKLTLYEQIMLRTETYLGSKEQVKGPSGLWEPKVTGITKKV